MADQGSSKPPGIVPSSGHPAIGFAGPRTPAVTVDGLPREPWRAARRLTAVHASLAVETDGEKTGKRSQAFREEARAETLQAAENQLKNKVVKYKWFKHAKSKVRKAVMAQFPEAAQGAAEAGEARAGPSAREAVMAQFPEAAQGAAEAAEARAGPSAREAVMAQFPEAAQGAGEAGEARVGPSAREAVMAQFPEAAQWAGFGSLRVEHRCVLPRRAGFLAGHRREGKS